MTGPRWLVPLAALGTIQSLTSTWHQMVSVLAPELTEAAGVATERIGELTALVSLGSIGFFLAGAPIIAHYGAARTLQVGALVATAGLALLMAASWPAMAVAALLLGLGYGPIAPASSEILARHGPPRRLSALFSIKQACAPLGGVLAGLALPPIVLLFGWRAAVATTALVGLLVIGAAEALRRSIGETRAAGPPPSLALLLAFRNLRHPAQALVSAPGLIAITAAGACFAAAQGSIFGFLVAFLVTQGGASLEAAGVAFATIHLFSIFGRVAMGWIADRIGSGQAALFGLGLGSVATCLAFAAVSPEWSWSAILVLMGFTGAAAASWNGVYLAEIARLAPPGAIAAVTSGSIAFMFLGYAIGPLVFALVVQSTGSWSASFAILALAGVAGGIAVVVARAQTGPSSN